MKVDFNNLRLGAIRDYNALVKELNSAIVTDVDMDRVVSPVEEIRKHIDSLRSNLVTMAACYIDNDPDCQCVLTPGVSLVEFAPKELCG